MMSPDDFRRLAAAGLSTDQIAIVMEMFHERDEARKADQRARWRKSQENKKNTHVSERELTTANVPHGGVARVEDKPLTQKIEPQQKEQKDTPRSRLVAVLDEERAGAVIEHRQRLRKPLTERAAKMLAADLSKFPDPNAAADRMILKGWLTIDVSWGDGPMARAGPAPPKRNAALDAADALMEKFNAVSPSQTEPSPPHPRQLAIASH